MRADDIEGQAVLRAFNAVGPGIDRLRGNVSKLAAIPDPFPCRGRARLHETIRARRIRAEGNPAPRTHGRAQRTVRAQFLFDAAAYPAAAGEDREIVGKRGACCLVGGAGTGVEGICKQARRGRADLTRRGRLKLAHVSYPSVLVCRRAQ